MWVADRVRGKCFVINIDKSLKATPKELNVQFDEGKGYESTIAANVAMMVVMMHKDKYFRLSTSAFDKFYAEKCLSLPIYWDFMRREGV